MSRKAKKSSRKKMATRANGRYTGQIAGFKLMKNNATGAPVFKPNRAKARQTLAIKRRNAKRFFTVVAEGDKESG